MHLRQQAISEPVDVQFLNQGYKLQRVWILWPTDNGTSLLTISKGSEVSCTLSISHVRASLIDNLMNNHSNSKGTRGMFKPTTAPCYTHSVLEVQCKTKWAEGTLLSRLLLMVLFVDVFLTGTNTWEGKWWFRLFCSSPVKFTTSQDEGLPKHYTGCWWIDVTFFCFFFYKLYCFCTRAVWMKTKQTKQTAGTITPLK